MQRAIQYWTNLLAALFHMVMCCFIPNLQDQSMWFKYKGQDYMFSRHRVTEM